MATNSEIIDSREAARRLGVSLRRVQQLVADGRLPAERMGGSLVIRASDLEKVSERKPGRPTLDRKPGPRKVKPKGNK